MKLGIRTKLITSIVLIIIMPIILTLGGLGFSLSKLEAETTNELNEIEKINRKLMEVIVDSYEYLNEDERYRQNLAPVLNQYQLNLQIINDKGQTIFDSREGSAAGKAEASFLSNQYRYNLPITISDEVVGTVIVIPDPRIKPYNIYAKLTGYVAVSIGAGLISLILLLVLFTWIITKNILNPLKELSLATEDIVQGNLEFEIKHKTKDELGQFCEAFNLMRARLKESLDKQAAYEASRKQLVANISHDLGTPIAIIKGYVEGLEDGVAKDEERFKRYLRVVKDKTEQLDRLIEDLSQYSRLELGHLEIKRVLTDSRELFESILSSYELTSEKSPVVFYAKRPIPSVSIDVDIHRIEQVMDNLIQNAKRYASQEPFIEVEIKLLDKKLQVAVKDNGIGISEEDLPYVFEMLYRGEKSRSREFGGSGQGLAICKFIIEAHGGQIWVKSIRGKGSTFFFTIPCCESEVPGTRLSGY
jgi:signal transduction histidine kinase